MHVVHVINNLPVGGAEVFLVQLTRAQKELGLRPRVVALGEANPLAQELVVPFESLGRQLNDPRLLGDLVRTLRSQPVDLVHTHLFYADFYGRLACRLRGIPCISTEHSTAADMVSRKRVWAMRWTRKWSRRVVAVSPAVQVSVRKRLGLPADSVPMIANGLDLDAFRNVQPLRRDPVAASTLLIGCVGRIVASKGYDCLLRAVARPEAGDVHVWMVGEGQEEGALRTLARELGIADRITWLGLRRDVARILAAVDVFAMPSTVEGHSIAMLEAMASGCALVVSDIPELAESVGDAALRVPPGDIAAFGAAIGSLQSAPERQRLRGLALSRAQRYSIGASARAYAKLYNDVVGSRTGIPETA